MYKLVTSDNGFQTVEIGNDVATAKIALQGAHVYEYNRYAEPALLWVSKSAYFETGKAIRGGIPVCWPWFGKDKEHPERPQHGFARTAMWTLENVNEPNDLLTIVTLSLTYNQIEQPYFPYKFRVRMQVSVGESLSVSLTTENHGDVPFTVSEALHTYFNVGSISAVNLIGLEGVTYADALDNFRKKTSGDSIGITHEIDRVYLDTTDLVILKDDRYGRSIMVNKSGSRSTVVWNPWIDKAAMMPDFDDDGYTSMICIETANALSNAITLPPKKAHTVTQTIT